MKTVIIRNVEIGSGMPKICAPIVGGTRQEILDQAAAIKAAGTIDIAEWRIDWFDQALDRSAVLDMLEELHMALGTMPLLATFRTREEGGSLDADPETYTKLNMAVAASKFADLVDVELFTGEKYVRKMIDKAHDAGVQVIASSHDFTGTPSEDEIVSRMLKMQETGADILKVAVMPTCAEDVLTLLQATLEMKHKYADRPVVTMSMSGTGTISRISGEIFGSAMTFASVGRSSAPGQIDAGSLKSIMQVLHGSLAN